MLVNTLPLWTPVHNPISEHPRAGGVMDGWGPTGSHLQLKSYGQLMAAREGRVSLQ